MICGRGSGWLREAFAETLRRLRDAGVTMVLLLADDAAVERFAADVRPLL